MSLSEYFASIEGCSNLGQTNEHTYRPYLITFLESISNDFNIINEPKKTEFGNPDIVIMKNFAPIGYIDTKKISSNLAKEEKSEQIQRYIKGFNNFMLTNYLEFWWYVDGKLRKKINITQDSNSFFNMFALFLTSSNLDLNSKNLSYILAEYSKLIKNQILEMLNDKQVKTLELYGQYELIKKVLIHDITEKEFSDMYAQTISYGLFTARYYCKKEFSRHNAAEAIPKTNPFLRRMFYYILSPDMDIRINWLIDNLVSLLSNINVEKLLNDFTENSDKVIHFYQNFLQKYNPTLREQRGVYYTPDQIVKYIVNSVDEILIREFKIKKGLADTTKLPDKDIHKVQILDPALGTGTFLFHVIENIYSKEKVTNLGTWNDYISNNLLPRLYGFEYLMAPYAVAHMKIGLQLSKLKYDYDSENYNERVHVYLTNTLNLTESSYNELHLKWITDEANDARKIKEKTPLMVILGNPPYSNGKQETSNYIKNLLKSYKKNISEKKFNLTDEYIKFIRWSQDKINKNGYGILAFVTNHSFLEGITHRQMRKSLMDTFDRIYILDMHGNKQRKEKNVPPNDENVFDIPVGVSINIFIKNNQNTKTKVYRYDITGTKKEKFQFLEKNDIYSTEFKEIKNIYQKNCLGDFRFFNNKTYHNINSYCKCWSLKDIFVKTNGGVQTSRNKLFIDFKKLNLENRFLDLYYNRVCSETEQKYPLHESSTWSPKKLNEFTYDENKIIPYLFRPFDVRYIYYDKDLLGRDKYNIMQHMMKSNLSLLALRQTASDTFNHVFVTNLINDRNTLISNNVSDKVFPLYLYQDNLRSINFNKKFIQYLKGLYDLSLSFDSEFGDFEKEIGPKDIFSYIYAILNSEEYISHFEEQLMIDFPRIHFASSLDRFKEISKLGRELINTHLMNEEFEIICYYNISGNHEVQKYEEIKMEDNNTQIWINQNQYFDRVPAEALDFKIGSTSIIKDWLKSRKGTKLSQEDIIYFQRMVSAIVNSKNIKNKIDKLIIKELPNLID